MDGVLSVSIAAIGIPLSVVCSEGGLLSFGDS
jgi:hypothetical protein